MKEKTYETEYNGKTTILKLIKVDEDTIESTLELKSNKDEFRKDIISKIDFLNNEKIGDKLENEIKDHVKKDFVNKYVGSYLKKLGLDVENIDIPEGEKYIGVFCKVINITPDEKNKDDVINGYKPELRFYLDNEKINVLPILEQTGDMNLVECIEELVFLQTPPYADGSSYPLVRGGWDMKNTIKVGSIEQVPILMTSMKKMYEDVGRTSRFKELQVIKREMDKIKTAYENDYLEREIKHKIENDISKRYYLKMLEVLHGYIFL